MRTRGRLPLTRGDAFAASGARAAHVTTAGVSNIGRRAWPFLGEAPMHTSKEPPTAPRWTPNWRAWGGLAVGSWPWVRPAPGTMAWTVFAAALTGIILLPLGTIVVLAIGSEQN